MLRVCMATAGQSMMRGYLQTFFGATKNMLGASPPASLYCRCTTAQKR